MKPYVFDLELSARGLRLNRFLHGLTVVEKRNLFKENPEEAMKSLTEEEKKMVRKNLLLYLLILPIKTISVVLLQ